MAGSEKFVKLACPKCGDEVIVSIGWKLWSVVHVQTDGVLVDLSERGAQPLVDDVILECANADCEWMFDGSAYLDIGDEGTLALDWQSLRQELEQER